MMCLIMKIAIKNTEAIIWLLCSSHPLVIDFNHIHQYTKNVWTYFLMKPFELGGIENVLAY